MPFESKAQAKWMFANKPEMAREWASKTKSIKKLPVRKSRTFSGQYKPISTFTKKELELHRAKYLPEKYSRPVVIDDKYNPRAAIVMGTGKSNVYWPQTKARKGENYRRNISKFDSPAWTRSEGKNPNGGLNAKGRASAKAEGHNLKPPVKSGDNPRRKSFLARMGNMPGPEHKPNGEPTRLLLSLNAWGASSKADAKRKAAAMGVSKSYELVSKTFPQPAILREGSRRTRVMVTHVHATGKPYFGIIHPTEGQRIAHKDNITFIKHTKPAKPAKPANKEAVKPKPVQLDLFGEPLEKSMEYSVVMNQSRFGGASAVGKAYVEKTDKTHFADKLLTNVERLTQEIKSHNASAYRKGIRHGARHNAKILVPAGAVGGSAVTATGMTIHQRRKREPINVHVVKDDTPMYDQMGQPVERKKSRNPLANMSGNAKLGTAGGAIGLAGVQRMAMAGTLPGKLKAQADAANARVKFQEDFAHSQNQRVQDATKIRNPLTRRRQVNMHTYYADKAADHLASAEGKKIMADNALKAAPAKRAAHLKSGAGLVATGATLGGLAAYNNAKERKMRGKTK